MSLHKKRIIILIDWFYPGYKAGGPIKSCLNLILVLRDLYDFYVLTTDTDHNETEPYCDIVPNKWIFQQNIGAHVYYAKKSTLSFRKIYNEVIYVQAEYVYLNHLFSPRFVIYPIILKLLHKIKSNVILCPRGALAESALSHKLYKKKPLMILYGLINLKQIGRAHV